VRTDRAGILTDGRSTVGARGRSTWRQRSARPGDSVPLDLATAFRSTWRQITRKPDQITATVLALLKL
jgi:hypothetical protein